MVMICCFIIVIIIRFFLISYNVLILNYQVFEIKHVKKKIKYHNNVDKEAKGFLVCPCQMSKMGSVQFFFNFIYLLFYLQIWSIYIP